MIDLKEYGLEIKPEYKVKDVAQALGTGIRNVQKLIKNGKIVAVKRGKAYVIPRANLIEYLEKGNDSKQIRPIEPELVHRFEQIADSYGIDPSDLLVRMITGFVNDKGTKPDEIVSELAKYVYPNEHDGSQAMYIVDLINELNND